MSDCAYRSTEGLRCQFTGSPAPFREVYHHFCHFHLPLRYKDGTPSPKLTGRDGWGLGGPEWGVFEKGIIERLRDARENVNLAIRQFGANFEGVEFPPDFAFTGAAGIICANFTNTKFGDKISFSDATFGRHADFTNAAFGTRACFERVKFKAGVWFANSKFGTQANFKGAIFESPPDPMGSPYRYDADFTAATFGDGADFSDARFIKQAYFRRAIFRLITNFNNAKFHEDADFSTDLTGNTDLDIRNISFNNAHFNGLSSFENRKFSGSASFNDAIFNNLVNFHGCTFHQGMSFRGAQFNKTRGKDKDEGEALERSYRTLKLGMEELRARNEEAIFFAHEMECRRQRGDVPWIERFAATMYKHMSDYGRAMDLPLISLLVLTYVSYFLYLAIAIVTCEPGAIARLLFTIEQIFRPFFIWATPKTDVPCSLVLKSPLPHPIPRLAAIAGNHRSAHPVPARPAAAV